VSLAIALYRSVGRPEVEEYLQANRALWDAWTPFHTRSAFYDVEGFKAGASRLKPLEIEEVGDVAGQSLLHLQCHFGLDTLSWARRGAKVTGADFSEEAISQARSLSAELGIEARFVRANLYDLPDVITGPFDIVFTSYGVIEWLPDLRRWAEVIAHFLRPGGTFYIAEFHPFRVLLEESEEGELKIRYPYFHTPEPLVLETQGSYADPSAPVRVPEYSWCHSLSDVVNAVIGAGLMLTFLHEFPYCYRRSLSCMEQGEDGRWHLPGANASLPLLFSLKATRPAR
jgi:SAM-dependent methyltransferase